MPEPTDIIDRRRMAIAYWPAPEDDTNRNGLREWVLYGDTTNVLDSDLTYRIDEWEKHDRARRDADVVIGPDPEPAMRLRRFAATLPPDHPDRPGVTRAIDVLLGDE